MHNVIKDDTVPLYILALLILIFISTVDINVVIGPGKLSSVRLLSSFLLSEFEVSVRR